jgi:hypothetical protein
MIRPKFVLGCAFVALRVGKNAINTPMKVPCMVVIRNNHADGRSRFECHKVLTGMPSLSDTLASPASSYVVDAPSMDLERRACCG